MSHRLTIVYSITKPSKELDPQIGVISNREGKNVGQTPPFTTQLCIRVNYTGISGFGRRRPDFITVSVM